MNDTIHLEQPREIVCIVCPNGCRILCEPTEGGVRFSGQKCKRGEVYASAELTHPMRSLTTSVKTIFPDSPVVSVRTNGEVEKSKLLSIVAELGRISVARRIQIGDIVVENICGTGVNVICTSDRLVKSQALSESKGVKQICHTLTESSNPTGFAETFPRTATVPSSSGAIRSKSRRPENRSTSC